MVKEFEVWAEKYRPKKFDEIINQEHAVERVKAFAEAKNIPHMLFAGPPGTGKTTLAIVLARELYGENWKQNVLSLNASVSKDTPIIVRINGEIKRVKFKDLDNLYFSNNSDEYVKVNNLEVLSLDENFKVCWKKVSYLIRHRVSKILRVHLEGGAKIELTGNHSVMMLTENGLLSKEASEIKEGDYLISFVCSLQDNKDVLNLENYLLKHTSKRAVALRHLSLDKSISWVLGLYTAEGCIGQNKNRGKCDQVVFTLGLNETELVEKLINIARENGIPIYSNLTSSGFDRSRYSAVQIRFLSTQLASFLKNNFYDGIGFVAKNKRLPTFIYSSSIGNRVEFLKGVADGDGSGNFGEVVRISSVSKELLIDIAWLARISGIESSVFEDEVRLIWKGGMKYKKSNLLPFNVVYSLIEKIGSKIKTNWRYLLRHQLYERKKRISKSALRYILSKVDINSLNQEEKVKFDLLNKLAESDIHVLKVKKIEIVDYDDFVYDVSVPGTEMFFAGNIPILLHNSDERGIDVIRGQVKEFARSVAIGDVPFKLVILDEADAMTSDAQQALRRMMEMYASVTRFILICNYSSKIIEPIQSRCAVFRFKALDDKHVREFVERIAKGENLKITEDGINAVVRIAEGDLRRAANILQAASIIKEKITEDVVYEAASLAKPQEVKQMLELALQGKFVDARKILEDMILKKGLSGQDIISEIHRQIIGLNIGDLEKVQLIEKCGEIDFRISEGANELIQIESLLAHLMLIGKKK